mgnify:CR=1 FL=1
MAGSRGLVQRVQDFWYWLQVVTIMIMLEPAEKFAFGTPRPPAVVAETKRNEKRELRKKMNKKERKRARMNRRETVLEWFGTGASVWPYC